MKVRKTCKLGTLALISGLSLAILGCNAMVIPEKSSVSKGNISRAAATQTDLLNYDLAKGVHFATGNAGGRALDLSTGTSYDDLGQLGSFELFTQVVKDHKELLSFIKSDFMFSANAEFDGIGTNVNASTSVSSSILHSTTFSNNSITQIGKIEEVGRTIELATDAELTDQAQSCLDTYGQKIFRQRYGDAWATRVELGGKVYFVMTTTVKSGTSLDETQLQACAEVAVETLTTDVTVETSYLQHGLTKEVWESSDTKIKLFCNIPAVLHDELTELDENGNVLDFKSYSDYIRLRSHFIEEVSNGNWGRMQTVYAPYNCLSIPTTEYSDLNNWKLVRLVVENAYNLASIKVGSGHANAADANMKSTSLARLTSIDYILDHWTIDNATPCNYLSETATYQAYIDSWVPSEVLFPTTSKSSTVTGNYDTRTNTAWMEIKNSGKFIFNLTPGVTYQISGIFRKVNIQDSMNTMKVVTPAGNFTATTAWQSLNVTFTSKGNDFILSGGAYSAGRLELQNLVFSRVDTPRNFITPTYNKVGKVSATNCSYPVESKNITMSGLGTAAEKFVFNLQPGKKYRVTGQFIKSIKNCTTYTVGLITPVGVLYPTTDWTPFNFIFTSNGQDFYMNYSAYVPTGSSVYFGVDNLVFEQLN